MSNGWIPRSGRVLDQCIVRTVPARAERAAQGRFPSTGKRDRESTVVRHISANFEAEDWKVQM